MVIALVNSIISKDTNIRFDFALRIANILGIGTREICSGALFELDEEQEKAITLPEFPSGLDAALDGNRIKTYLNNSMLPLMKYFGKENMPKVDKHLTSYYMLTDEGRNEVDRYIEYILTTKKDSERVEQIKSIKKW